MSGAADNPLLRLAREEIIALRPYAHAAWEPTLRRLHANVLGLVLNEVSASTTDGYCEERYSRDLRKYYRPQHKVKGA